MRYKKILVIYYSRTGITRKIAKAIARSLKADLEEIVDKKPRDGALGYVKAGKDAMSKSLTEINKSQTDYHKYDLVIIGTPVWAWTLTPAIRTFLVNNVNWFNDVAFFCTMGGAGDDKTFNHMEEICNKKPVATNAWLTKEIKTRDDDEISQLAKELIMKVTD